MATFSTDADLLKWEPTLMREIVLDHQCLTHGNGASSHTFSVVAASGLFITSKVRTQHVIHLKNADQGVDNYYEILSVESEMELMAGMVGGHGEEWVPLPTATALEFRIQTFDPQHEDAAETLLSRFGLEADSPNGLARWVAQRQFLRRASVALALAVLYRNQADGGMQRKAEHYARLYEDEVAKARLVLDRDSETRRLETPDA